jgi:protein-glutamine gamma-glutamyltransferase
MRLTRLGASVLAADTLAFFGALISGNNLLYLVSGALAAFWAAAAVLNRRAAAGIGAALSLPDQIFRDAPFRIGVTLRSNRRRPAYPFDLTSYGERRPVGFIPRGGTAFAEPIGRLGRRGKNRLDGLAVETAFPFGFFRSARRLPGPIVTVFPALSELYGRTAAPAVREERVARPRRGVGDDFHGLREYVRGEDARLINWKLTAKTGKPLVKEYAHAEGRRVTITVSGAPGPGAEERIAEAASLVKFHIDSGADVRLRTDEGEIDFGHGLLHLQALLEKLALLGEGKEPPGPPRRAGLRPGPADAAGAPGLGWLYLVTAAAFGSLFLIEELDPFFLALAALVIPVGALFDLRKIYPLPKILLDFGALAVLLFALFVDVRTAGMVRTVVHILLYVLAYSLWSPKTERTLQRIFLTDFLVFFLASGQAVDLIYLIFFAVYLLASAAWLVRRSDPPGTRDKRPAWLRGVAAVFLRCMAAAGLLFVAMPRIYSPRMQQLLASTGLTRFQNPAVSFAGLSDRVDLGFFGTLRKNPARVMRVSFVSGDAQVRPADVVRVRAAAFDEFTGRRWVRAPGDFEIAGETRPQRSREGTFRLRGRRGRIEFPGYDPARPEIIEEFFVYPIIASFVFSVGGIGALDGASYSASFDLDDTVYFPGLYAAPTRYRVHSQGEGADYHRAVGGYDILLKERFLRVPRADPRWKQYAERRMAASASPYEKARALENWFRTRFTYSLAADDNRQDLDSFLWSSQAGNCEYFASAMALLLRHVGIPSRLAIGFLSAEWNEFGAFYEVRQSDAHAWVEAYFPDRGWTTFDPTPPDLDAGGGATFLGRIWKRLGRYVSALEARWYRYVVGYDSDTQKTLFDILRIRWIKALRAAGIWLLIAALGAAVLIRWKPWKRRIGRRGRRRAGQGFYAVILARLERAGLPRPIWQTPADFAAAVVRRRPDLTGLTSLTARYYEIRFAGRSLSAAERQALDGETQSFLAAIKAGRRGKIR